MSRHWRKILLAVIVIAFFAAMVLPALQPGKEFRYPPRVNPNTTDSP